MNVTTDQKPKQTPVPATEPLRVGVLEAARIIGLSRAQLYNRVKSGKIRAVKEGRQTLFTMKELRAYVERGDPN